MFGKEKYADGYKNFASAQHMLSIKVEKEVSKSA